MGCKVTAQYFDMCLHHMLQDAGLLHKGVEQVHDDHGGGAKVIYDDDPEGRSHFHLLRRYLKACSERRVRISPKKLVLFDTQVDLGGVLHMEGGMKPCPSRYQAILDEPEPEWVDQVYKVMCALGWNRSFIPNFAVLEHPIRVLVMSKLGASKKMPRRSKKFKLENTE